MTMRKLLLVFTGLLAICISTTRLSFADAAPAPSASAAPAPSASAAPLPAYFSGANEDGKPAVWPESHRGCRRSVGDPRG